MQESKIQQECSSTKRFSQMVLERAQLKQLLQQLSNKSDLTLSDVSHLKDFCIDFFKKISRKDKKQLDKEKIYQAALAQFKLGENYSVLEQLNERDLLPNLNTVSSVVGHQAPEIARFEQVKKRLKLCQEQQSNGNQHLEEDFQEAEDIKEDAQNSLQVLEYHGAQPKRFKEILKASLQIEKDNYKHLQSNLQEQNRTEEANSMDDKELQDNFFKANYKQFKCYVCKQPTLEIHKFYHKMCASCGDFNFQKRNQTCDLNGRVALVTGGRIKIGYKIVATLLRNGARVLVTSRFPNDTALRYAQEPDFNEFKDRLQVFALDLRNLAAVEKLCTFLKNQYTRLDIIINNAAQSIRRETKFYQHLLANEAKPRAELGEAMQKILQNCDCQENSESTALVDAAQYSKNMSTSVIMSQIPLLPEEGKRNKSLFPEQMTDFNEQQVDLSTKNSWVQEIDDVNIIEFAETQLINCWAPFILCQKLKPLMERTPGRKFIVNVSSMEGVFYQFNKRSAHVQNNISKAGLNMLTRTCGRIFASSDIYVTSVDTGHVSNMFPQSFDRNTEKGLVPLDELDGAMRVLDPIFSGLTDTSTIPHHSVFLKDYKPALW